MRLTDWTDYSLRVLMYCGVQPPERLVTIDELATNYGVSRHHLTKIVNELSRQGWLQTQRGRTGGLRLALPPQAINVGAVIRQSEPDFRLVECFDRNTDTCPLTPFCRLKRTLSSALDAYLAVLDGVTLADLLPPARSMARAMKAPAEGSMRIMVSAGKSSAAAKRTRPH